MDLEPPGRRHGLVLPVPVDRTGAAGPTRHAAGGAGWRRTSPGRYVPADVVLTPLQRVLEAGAPVHGRGAVTGWAALAWLGGRWSTGTTADGSPRPVPVAVGRHVVRPRPAIALCEERYDPRETLVVDGITVTGAVRSVCFEMRCSRDLTTAVTVLDMAAYDDLVTLDEVDAWMKTHPSYTGIGQGRDAVPLGCENSWSPMEVRSRLAWAETGRPVPLANRPVFDLQGRHLVTPDLLDPDAGVVLEYDGAAHAEIGRRRRDRGRLEQYAEHRLECVTVLAGDLRDQGEVAARIHAAYRRAARHPGPRTWTTDQPSWWVDTSTVLRRRDLAQRDRDVWLAYRAAS